MGQLKAKLKNELMVSEIVRDLVQNSGDSESDACNVLAEIVDDDWNKDQLKFFCKVPSHINPKKMRNAEIHSGVISTSFRKAVRDGWSKVCPILCCNKSVPFGEVRIGKGSIMKALNDNHISVPDSWIGRTDPKEPLLTRMAIKQEFQQLTPEQWDKLFEREKKNALLQCRVAQKQGKHVLYKRDLIKSWLITMGLYKKPKLSRSKNPTHNMAVQMIRAGKRKP